MAVFEGFGKSEGQRMFAVARKAGKTAENQGPFCLSNLTIFGWRAFSWLPGGIAYLNFQSKGGILLG